MKRSEGKSRRLKSSKDKEALNDIHENLIKPQPDKEQIRDKAEDIYYQRIERGEYGTAEDDWIVAEEYLRNSRTES